MKRVLVVGAGAVGQVYGAALERAGAQVTFFVRPRHRQTTEAGMQVSRMHTLSRRRDRHAMLSPSVLDTVDEAAASRWDAVWLCIPSNGVHEEGTHALLRALGEPLVVSLTPGLDDRAALASVVPEERLVTGLIPFLAWFEHATVDGRGLEETVVWFPPFARCAFEGKRAEAVAAQLRAGGLRADAVPGLAQRAPYGSAVLMPTVAELEVAGWSFSALDAVHRKRLRNAVGEAFRVVRAETGAAPPRGLQGLVRWVHPLTLRLINLLTPLNLEVFLRKHFTKVGHQTTRSLGVYVDRADHHGVGPVPALQALLAERNGLPDRSQTFVDGG